MEIAASPRHGSLAISHSLHRLLRFGGEEEARKDKFQSARSCAVERARARARAALSCVSDIYALHRLALQLGNARLYLPIYYDTLIGISENPAGCGTRCFPFDGLARDRLTELIKTIRAVLLYRDVYMYACVRVCAIIISR